MDNNIRLTFLDDNGLNYYLFDNNGFLIFSNILNQDNKDIILDFDSLNYSQLLKIHQEKENGYLSNNIFLRYQTKTEIIDLIDLIDKKCPKKDWDCEYVESIKPTNKPFEIGFITHNPTYGVQGVKIFNFNRFFDFNLIYEMDNLHFDGAFHNLAFSSNKNKFCLLLYSYQNHKDYITICEYSVEKNRHSLNERPINMFKTDFGYWDFGELDSKYLNDETLCIIRNSDLILFDLSKGKVDKVIKRDLNSPYSINSHSLKYELNNTSCMVDIKN